MKKQAQNKNIFKGVWKIDLMHRCSSALTAIKFHTMSSKLLIILLNETNDFVLL